MHAVTEYLQKNPETEWWELALDDDWSHIPGYPKGYEPLDTEQMTAVQETVEYFSQWTGDGWDWSVEQSMDPAPELRSCKIGPGRSDFLAYNKSQDHLVIGDAKFGRGTKVTAEKNPQLVNYAEAWCATHKKGVGPKRITLAIFQPRYALGGPKAEVWETDRAGIHLAMLAIKSRLETYDFEGVPPELEPGMTQCKYCPARLFCPKLDALGGASDLSEDVTKLGHARLGERLAEQETFKKYLAAVKEEVERRMADGVKVPGWKLVSGRGATVYKDKAAADAEADKLWGQDVFHPPERKSPAQLRDGLPGGKAFAKKHTILQSGKPRLVPESDPTPALEVYTPEQRLQMMSTAVKNS